MSSEDPFPALYVPALEPAPHSECLICTAAARARDRGHELGRVSSIR